VDSVRYVKFVDRKDDQYMFYIGSF